MRALSGAVERNLFARSKQTALVGRDPGRFVHCAEEGRQPTAGQRGGGATHSCFAGRVTSFAPGAERVSRPAAGRNPPNVGL